MRRGAFVAGSIAAATGASVAACSPTQRVATGRAAERIAVVGAGIAGLTCALTLRDAGLACRVFESSKRIGGRMHSERGYWDDDQHTEWCGAMIDSKHATMHALARRFRLRLIDTQAPLKNDARDTSYFHGRYYPMSAADRDFAPVYKILQHQLAGVGQTTTYASATPLARELDSISMAQWIDKYVSGGRASQLGKLIDDALANENGVDSSQQSSLNLVYMLGIQDTFGSSGSGMNVLGYSDQRYTIENGNQRLPLAIAAALPQGSIATEHRLTAMRPTSGSIELSFSTPQGDVIESFDRVVLAVPFIVLRGIDTTAMNFDTRKRAAIDELGYGMHTKLHVQFHGKPWYGPGPWPQPADGQIWTDTGFQNSIDFSLGQRGRSGIIERFTGGPSALFDTPPVAYAHYGDSPAVDAHVHRFFAQLDRIWPGVSKSWNGKATFGNAQADPNILASYSCWLVGQYTKFAGYEGARQDRVHFAGEHTSVEHQGFMEGGAISGVRAAREIVAEYKTNARSA